MEIILMDSKNNPTCEDLGVMETYSDLLAESANVWQVRPRLSWW